MALVVRAAVAVRRAPAVAVLRSAADPRSLARLALVPAARNLGVAICLLPAQMREEATATFLACRVLDAFEDIGGDREERRVRLLAAVDYLCGPCGHCMRPPRLWQALAVRDSERIDLLLADRIADVRELLSALAPERRARVDALLTGIGAVMARNLEWSLPREVYGERVLGEVAAYACEMIAARPLAAPQLCAALGALTQLANDLRDRECETFAVATRAELARHVFVRLPPLALATFALLTDVGAAVRSRGARAATAYMTITTASFLCREAGAPLPYRRRSHLMAALRAGTSPRRYAAMLARVAEAANGAIVRVMALPGPDHCDDTGGLALFDVTAADRPAPAGLAELLVDAAFRLVDELPTTELTGALARTDVLRLMLADHLVFDALDHVDPDRVGEMREFADLIQQTATKGVIT